MESGHDWLIGHTRFFRFIDARPIQIGLDGWFDELDASRSTLPLASALQYTLVVQFPPGTQYEIAQGLLQELLRCIKAIVPENRVYDWHHTG